MTFLSSYLLILLSILFLSIILIIISLVIYYESMKTFKERSKQINKENILKDGFSPKKIEEIGNFDVIIIGSGIGGLTTAALLSRIGIIF